MKTNRILFLAMTALVLSACSNEEEDDWNNEIRLNVSIPAEELQLSSVTRAVGADLMTAFSGEKVHIYITDHGNNAQIVSAQYTATGTALTNFTAYYPTTGNTVDIKGYYPYQPTDFTGVTVTNASTAFAVQANQSTLNAYKASDLMYAHADNCARGTTAHSLVFNHALSKIIVEVKGDGTVSETATVTLKNVKLKATLTNGVFSSLASSNNDATTVSMGTTTNNLSSTGQSLSAIIPPQTINASTQFIEVALASGAKYTYSIPTGGKTFEAGNAYTYTITLGVYGISVSASVGTWGNGGSTAIGSQKI